MPPVRITRSPATRPEDLRAARAQLAQSESGRAEVQVTVDEGRQFSPVDGEISVKVYYIAALADFATWRSSQDLGGFDLRTFEVRGRPTEPVDGLRTATRHDRAH